VHDCIPPALRAKIAAIQPWDDWDPDRDRWNFDYKEFTYPGKGLESAGPT
jgi:hypothetical protein